MKTTHPMLCGCCPEDDRKTVLVTIDDDGRFTSPRCENGHFALRMSPEDHAELMKRHKEATK